MLIRVFKIPPPTGQTCFGGGNPAPFIEVDWFRDDPNPFRPDYLHHNAIAEIIKGKCYYSPDTAILVLSERYVFTLNYKAP